MDFMTEHPEVNTPDSKGTEKQDSAKPKEVTDWEKRYKDAQSTLTPLQQELAKVRETEAGWKEFYANNPDAATAIEMISKNPGLASKVLGKASPSTEEIEEEDDLGDDYLPPKAKKVIKETKEEVKVLKKQLNDFVTKQDQRDFEIGKKLYQEDLEMAKSRSEYRDIFSDSKWKDVANSLVDTYLKEHPISEPVDVVKYAGQKTQEIKDKAYEGYIQAKQEQKEKFPPEGGGSSASPKPAPEKYTVSDGGAYKKARARIEKEL